MNLSPKNINHKPHTESISAIGRDNICLVQQYLEKISIKEISRTVSTSSSIFSTTNPKYLTYEIMLD